MAITIHKILSVKDTPGFSNGLQTVEFVLTDGILKVKYAMSELPNDDALARTAIMARAPEFFMKGIPWGGITGTNILSPKKSLLALFKDEAAVAQAVAAATTVDDLKPVILAAASAIFAIIEAQE